MYFKFRLLCNVILYLLGVAGNHSIVFIAVLMIIHVGFVYLFSCRTLRPTRSLLDKES